MLKLENTEVLGWEHAIRGMRNPMNSWEKSDSFWTCSNDPLCNCDCNECDVKKNNLCVGYGAYKLGSNDHDLMMRLTKGGPVHAKYRRMIAVYVDITAPLYWWKEFDTYKVGTVANSCSTMHKIAAKEFTLEDFSCGHLLCYRDVVKDLKIGINNACCIPDEEGCGEVYPNEILEMTINMLNKARTLYLEIKEKLTQDMERPRMLELQAKQKKYWWQMIQLLPSSYNQKRTVMLNYEVLAGIYPSRKDHKLDEWHTFCDWIKELPYSEIITGMSESEKILRLGKWVHEGIKKGLEEGTKID